MGIPINQLPPHLRSLAVAQGYAKAAPRAAEARKAGGADLDSGTTSAAFLSSLPGRWLTRWRAAGGPEPVPEYRFHPMRQWRFDFAWPDAKVAVEIDGGTWKRGAHSRGKGQANDAEKANAAACMGWTVLRWTTDMVEREAGIADAVGLVRGRSPNRR